MKNETIIGIIMLIFGLFMLTFLTINYYEYGCSNSIKCDIKPLFIEYKEFNYIFINNKINIVKENIGTGVGVGVGNAELILSRNEFIKYIESSNKSDIFVYKITNCMGISRAEYYGYSIIDNGVLITCFDFNNNYKKGYYNIEIIDDENYIYRIAYSEVFITILFGLIFIIFGVGIVVFNKI